MTDTEKTGQEMQEQDEPQDLGAQFADGIDEIPELKGSSQEKVEQQAQQQQVPPQPPTPPFAPQFQFPPVQPYPVPWPVPVPQQPPQEEQWSWEKALSEPGYVERFVSRLVERERQAFQSALAAVQEQVNTERFSWEIRQAEPVLGSFVREHAHEFRDPNVLAAFRDAIAAVGVIAATNGDASPFTKREMYSALLAVAKERASATPRSVQGRTAEVLDQRRGQAPAPYQQSVEIEPWEEQLMREWGISREDWIKNKMSQR